MPDLQTSTHASAAPVVLEIPALHDEDIALGCECADPALQIERWMQEAQGLGNAS